MRNTVNHVGYLEILGKKTLFPFGKKVFFPSRVCKNAQNMEILGIPPIFTPLTIISKMIKCPPWAGEKE